MVRYLPVEYKEINTQFTSEFFGLVNSSNNISITSHLAPDEDSISSVLSIYHLLISKYPEKNIRLLYSSDKDSKYQIFRHFDKIEFVGDIADHLENTDLLIMLDGSNYSRFSKKPETLKEIFKTIVIDHHCSPIDNFTLSLVAPQYPACVEIIYRSLFTDFPIDKPLAEIFLMGILGDTGNFTYLKSHQTGTLEVAKSLLDISKIEIQEFLASYQSISTRVFEVVKELIKNTIYSSVSGWPDFQYSHITRTYSEKLSLTNSEISEASHIYSTEYLRTIEGYTWGFVISPNTNGDVNISCRSLPKSVNVRIFLEKLIKGGGHDRASGGTFYMSDKPVSVTDSLKKTLDWINSNSPDLD